MRKQLRWMGCGATAGLILAGVLITSLRAQTGHQPLPTEVTQVRFNSGQSVVPYYEGWLKNPDGTFDLVFGYFNRNWKQELAVPVGPDNKIEPGGPDAGQPTYFLPRRQRFLFRMRVPADFGKNEVTWTITSNGRTEKGFGTLQPEQEITERVIMTNGNFNPGTDDPNRPPTLTIAPIPTPAPGTPITLAASVTDDGLPKPRVAAPRPTATPTPGGFGAQVNSSAGVRPVGLRVNWLQYSGPAKVLFSHTGQIPVANGQAVTTAQFPAPGTYTLIASATDGSLARKANVMVTVPGTRVPSGQP
jgi:hypothetical protein